MSTRPLGSTRSSKHTPAPDLLTDPDPVIPDPESFDHDVDPRVNVPAPEHSGGRSGPAGIDPVAHDVDPVGDHGPGQAGPPRRCPEQPPRAARSERPGPRGGRVERRRRHLARGRPVGRNVRAGCVVGRRSRRRSRRCGGRRRPRWHRRVVQRDGRSDEPLRARQRECLDRHDAPRRGGQRRGGEADPPGPERLEVVRRPAGRGQLEHHGVDAGSSTATSRSWPSGSASARSRSCWRSAWPVRNRPCTPCPRSTSTER